VGHTQTLVEAPADAWLEAIGQWRQGCPADVAHEPKNGSWRRR
jgi:hypothetical protein